MKQVTTFEGQVNGQRFTDRDEMSRYITRLMENNQSINDLQYSTKTQWVQEDDEKGCGDDCRKESPVEQTRPILPWNEYIKEVQKEIPDAYDTILGYLIPYVNEEPFANFAPEHEDELFVDLKQKLTRRMHWMEQYLFSECNKRKETGDPAMMKFFRNLYHSFCHKAEWAGDRVCFMNWMLGEVEDEKLTWGIKKDTILWAIKVYEEVETFCRACADIVTDNTGCYD